MFRYVFFHLLLTLLSLCVRKVNDGFKRFPSDQNLQAHSKVSGPKLALVPKTNTQCLTYLCSFSYCTVWTKSRTASHGHITYLNLSAKYYFWHCHMHTQIMLGGFSNIILYFFGTGGGAFVPCSTCFIGHARNSSYFQLGFFRSQFFAQPLGTQWIPSLTASSSSS